MYKIGKGGFFARGMRNGNGQMLCEILDRHKFISPNIIFKHKASEITTWEGIINQKIVYNKIDHVATPSCCKFSLICARSYRANKVETDHRLVAVKMHNKLDWERGKAKETKRATEDPVLIELKTRRRKIIKKTSQVKLEKLAGLKKTEKKNIKCH